MCICYSHNLVQKIYFVCACTKLIILLGRAAGNVGQGWESCVLDWQNEYS